MSVMTALRGLLLLPLAVGGLATRTADAPPPAWSVTETTLKSGETLERALRRTRRAPPGAPRITAAPRGEGSLRPLRRGERLRVPRAPAGHLQEIVYARTPV